MYGHACLPLMLAEADTSVAVQIYAVVQALRRRYFVAKSKLTNMVSLPNVS